MNQNRLSRKPGDMNDTATDTTTSSGPVAPAADPMSMEPRIHPSLRVVLWYTFGCCGAAFLAGIIMLGPLVLFLGVPVIMHMLLLPSIATGIWAAKWRLRRTFSNILHATLAGCAFQTFWTVFVALSVDTDLEILTLIVLTTTSVTFLVSFFALPAANDT